MADEKSREEIAKENEVGTTEAHRLAAEQLERDRQGGARPVSQEVAESVAEKLKAKFGTAPEGEEGN